jgi:bifunctional NMN adenylyltransferase/nudix hydrolase
VWHTACRWPVYRLDVIRLLLQATMTTTPPSVPAAPDNASRAAVDASSRAATATVHAASTTSRAATVTVTAQVPASSSRGLRIRTDDIAVLIGRFAPFQHRHEEALRAALANWQRVVVVITSAFQAPSPKNPFSWEQRADMIRLCLSDEECRRVAFVPVRDHHRDERWAADVAAGVQRQVPDATPKQLTVVHPEFTDAGEYTIECPKVLPRWGQQSLPIASRQHLSLDGATVRSVLLSVDAGARAAALAFLRDAVPDPVRHYLSAWWESPLREKLAAEAQWIHQYRERWPAEQAMTVDTVVVCSGHVLLIERGEGAGAGLFAVPGGFLEKDERFYAGAKRELREETGLGYIGDGLDTAFVRAEVFDRPDRSMRARIVTVAHLFDLKSTPLPDVQGRDDARHALWVPIAELAGMEDRFFEDHFQILDFFLELTRP